MIETNVWITDEVDLSALTPDQRSALRHWQENCPAGQDMPSRADIDPPLALTAVLPMMIMFDVERPDGPEAPARMYRYRVFGTEMVTRAGRDLTGLTLAEVFGVEATAEDLKLYAEVERRRLPYFGTRISMVPRRQSFETYSRLLLPLRGPEGQRVERLWCVLDFDDR